MHFVLVSSYVPRKCGIATYTKDLTEQLQKKRNKIEIIAMNDPVTNVTYESPVSYTIKQHEKKDYETVAQELNKKDIDFVHIQHEFGLFGGADGEYVLDLARALKKPLVVTFHTVLLEPSDNQKYIIQELARLSRVCVVMEAIAQDRLESVYAINPHDIHVIYHGVPTLDGLTQNEAKERVGYHDKFLLIASNLISRNKGLEYAISAIPEIARKIPNIQFLIIGETHPVVKSQEGESYREELQKLVSDLHIEKYVTFINRYISLNELKTYLEAADVCVTPYLDPQQITSGTLAYAMGVGKVCISTPFLYAQHLLEDGRGVLVPFKDKTAIAEAFIQIYKNPKKRKEIEEKAHTLGREMRWPQVALKHIAIYKDILHRHKNIANITARFIKKPLNLTYLEFLTDHTGILQHSYYNLPETRFGYSTDDNSRALIVVSKLYKNNRSKKLFQLMKIYLTFLRLAQEPNGRFHTFLNFQRHWVDLDDITDPYGKAMWALGYHLYACNDSPFFHSVHEIFKLSMRHIKDIRDARTAAYVILGLYYYVLAFEGEKDTARFAIDYIKKLAGKLVKIYQQHSDPQWQWIEETMTYDNFRIPQALFAAYLITEQPLYKEIAIESLDFVLKCNYDFEKDYFDFVGQNGWYKKNEKKASYDQQPLEASAAVDSFIFAYRATKKSDYSRFAIIALEWFFGRNRNHKELYDKKTKGVFDGLTKVGVNLNEGSESVICFLIANISLQNALKKG